MYVGTAALSGAAESPATSQKVTLGTLPSGRAGTIATLKHMKKFVLDAVRDPSQTIRNKALSIFTEYGVPPRDYKGEAGALHRFVRDRIRYVRDPVDVELVQDPAATLSIGQGDCDDKSTLLAALLTATGHPSKFSAIGMNGGPFSHVLVESLIGPRWTPMETIIQKPIGWWPSGVTSKYSLNISGGG